MKKIFFFLISMILFSCTEKSSIEYINIYYLPASTTAQIPISCSSLYGKWKPKLRYHQIDNNSALKKFESIYSEYEISKNKSTIEDVRIRTMIHYKNDRIDTLCLGEYFGSYINGKKVNDLEKMLSLIKKEINYESHIK